MTCAREYHSQTSARGLDVCCGFAFLKREMSNVYVSWRVRGASRI